MLKSKSFSWVSHSTCTHCDRRVEGFILSCLKAWNTEYWTWWGLPHYIYILLIKTATAWNWLSVCIWSRSLCLPPSPFLFPVSCDFGVYPDTNTCEWVIGEDSALTWKTGTGQTSNWLGGPISDFSSEDTSGEVTRITTSLNWMVQFIRLFACTPNFVPGGYAFVETSQIPLQGGRVLYPGAILKSPALRSTGPEGSCINFAWVSEISRPVWFWSPPSSSLIGTRSEGWGGWGKAVESWSWSLVST